MGSQNYELLMAVSDSETPISVIKMLKINAYRKAQLFKHKKGKLFTLYHKNGLEIYQSHRHAGIKVLGEFY